MAFITGQAIQRISPNKQSGRWIKSGGGGGAVDPIPATYFVFNATGRARSVEPARVGPYLSVATWEMSVKYRSDNIGTNPVLFDNQPGNLRFVNIGANPNGTWRDPILPASVLSITFGEWWQSTYVGQLNGDVVGTHQNLTAGTPPVSAAKTIAQTGDIIDRLWNIGASGGVTAASNFTGAIAQIRIIYNGQLRHYWPMDEGTGATSFLDAGPGDASGPVDCPIDVGAGVWVAP